MKIFFTRGEFYVISIFVLFLSVIIVISKTNKGNPTLTPNVIPSFSLMPTEMVLIDNGEGKVPWRELSVNEIRARKQNNTVWPSTGAPDILDQGPWGSCTSFCMRYAYLLWLKKRSLSVVEPSTAFWYAQSRRRIYPGGRLQDTGSTTYATVLTLTDTGVPFEDAWPYKSRNVFSDPPATLVIPAILSGMASPYNYSSSGAFPGFKQLPQVSGASESRWKNQSEMFIDEIDSGRAVLASIYAYGNLTPQVLVTGIWPPPGRNPIGGHAICLIGYVRGLSYETSVFTFFNSWGAYSGSFNQTGDGNVINGGIAGLFSIPFNYVANYKYSGDWWSL